MANETLITDLVAQEAMQQLEQLDRAMEGTLQQFQNCARELAQGLKVPVEVTGDVDALRTLTNTVMRDAQQATQQLTQQLQQQQQVVANTTNTISRQLQAQENLNKAQREAFTQDQQAQDLAKALLGTRQQNYELLARYTAEMKANKDAQKQVNEEEKRGLITQEEAIQRRAQLMAAYDRTKVAAAELTKILAAENREANAVQGSYQQLSQKLERLKQAYKQMTDAQKASVGGQAIEKEIQNLDAHLKDLAADMGEHQRNVGNYAIAAQSMKSTLRELTEEIAQLTIQYNELSDEEQKSDIGMQMRDKITELTEQAGKYKDIISDVKQSISGSASDTRLFDSLIEAGQVFAATMGVAETACRALGMSEDSLQQSMLKVQQAMQAVQALQVIQNTLQKQSNLMKGIAILQSKAAAQAAKMEAAATASATGATKAQTVAQAAFNAVAKANPYVLLATAILAVIGLVVSYTAATEDATAADEAAKKAADERKESMESFAQSFGNTAGEMLVKYQSLRDQWNALGDDIAAKRKFLVQHKNDFLEVANAAGIDADEISTVNGVETILNKKTGTVVAAIKKRALAMAAYAEAVRLTQLKLQELEKASIYHYHVYKPGERVSRGDLAKAGISLTEDQRAAAQYDGYGGGLPSGTTWLTADQAAKMTEYYRQEQRKKAIADMNAISKKYDDMIDRTLARAGVGNIGEAAAAANGPIVPAGGGGGGNKPSSTKPSRAPSGSSGGSSNQPKPKEQQELKDILLDILIDANKRTSNVTEEYSAEWARIMKEIFDDEKKKEIAENKEKYDTFLADLKLSLEKGKITKEQYDKMEAEAKEVFNRRKLAIDKAYDNEKKKVDDERQKHQEELAKEKLEKLQQTQEKELEVINSETAARLDLVNKRYLGELAFAKDNAEEVERIKKDHAIEVAYIEMGSAKRIAEATIQQLEEQLKIENLSKEEREAIAKKLVEAKQHLNEIEVENTEKSLDMQVEAEKDAAEKAKEAHDKRMQFLQDWVQRAGEAVGTISELIGALYDNQIAKVEELIDAEQERYEKEINHIEWLAERGAITTEEAEIRKRDAEAAHAKQQEALEKKKAAWEYKKAVVEKANQVAQIGISTALGIMQALAMFPPNIPLSVFVGAMGAIQLATALAQPIKAYAEGTKGHPHPGGLAVVGDANRAELVMYGKRAWITPDSPTLVDLPKGAEVMPDASKVDLVQMGSSLFMTLPKRKGGGGPIIVNDYEALEGRVANNTKAVTQTLNRFERNVTRQMRRQNFRNYINART